MSDDPGGRGFRPFEPFPLYVPDVLGLGHLQILFEYHSEEEHQAALRPKRPMGFSSPAATGSPGWVEPEAWRIMRGDPPERSDG